MPLSFNSTWTGSQLSRVPIRMDISEFNPNILSLLSPEFSYAPSRVEYTLPIAIAGPKPESKIERVAARAVSCRKASPCRPSLVLYTALPILLTHGTGNMADRWGATSKSALPNASCPRVCSVKVIIDPPIM